MTELADRNLEEINLRLARLESLLRDGANAANVQAHACSPSGCPHRQKLKETILETIEVLEVSRKAFRSRHLELFRGKLTKKLSEIT